MVNKASSYAHSTPAELPKGQTSAPVDHHASRPNHLAAASKLTNHSTLPSGQAPQFPARAYDYWH
jgi:hypothetical protein